MELSLYLTECINRAVNVMCFTVHTGQISHDLRIEVSDTIKDENSFLCDWSKFISVENRPKIPVFVSRNSKGELSNDLVMAWTKAEKSTNRNKPNETYCDY